MNITNSIYRRLALLQRIADANRPTPVTVHFADGSTTVTDQSGALGLLQELGPRGKIDSFQTDGPMSGWARLLTGILHPAPDRRIEDFV